MLFRCGGGVVVCCWFFFPVKTFPVLNTILKNPFSFVNVEMGMPSLVQ